MTELTAPVPDPLAARPADEMGHSRTGNLLVWLGGGDWREVADPSERSAYQMSGVFVVLNAVIAGAVMTLAGTGTTRGPVVGALPFGVIWGLFVGAVDRTVSAVIVDGRRRTMGGYVARVVLTLLLGLIVAEAASMALFRDSIERTMSDSVQQQITESRSLVNGSPGHPSPRARELADLQQQVRALATALKTAQATYETSSRALQCVRAPDADCPPVAPGTDERSLASAKTVAGEEVKKARAKWNAERPALTEQITALQAGIRKDLAQATDLARAESGVVARWRAMHEYTWSDRSALTIRIILAAFLVLLDLMPLLFKLFRGQTGHDRRVLERRRRDAEDIAAHAGRRTARIDRESGLAAERGQVEQEILRERWATELKIEKARLEEQYEQEVRRLAEPPAPSPLPVRVDLRPPPPPAEPVSRWAEDAVRGLVGRRFGEYVATGALPGADRGGFGRMLLGHHVRRPDESVVIKAVDPQDEGQDPMAPNARRRMWEVEVEAAAELAPHTGIAKVLDHGYAHGHLWIASPRYVPGSLVRWVRDQGDVLTVLTTLSIIESVSEALGYAHARNRTHGDLKPQNIALSERYTKLLDWGLARVVRAAGAETSHQRPPGTVFYTAPEAFLETSWHRTYADLYSVGATWYFLLTGEPPFARQQQGRNLYQLVRAIGDGDLQPTPLLDLLPDLPTPVAELVHQLLSAVPADRFPGADPSRAAGELTLAIGELERQLLPGELEVRVGAAVIVSPTGPDAGGPPPVRDRPVRTALDNVVRLPTAAPNGTVPASAGTTQVEDDPGWP